VGGLKRKMAEQAGTCSFQFLRSSKNIAKTDNLADKEPKKYLFFLPPEKPSRPWPEKRSSWQQ
jgi:hypothetical protein